MKQPIVRGDAFEEEAAAEARNSIPKQARRPAFSDEESREELTERMGHLSAHDMRESPTTESDICCSNCGHNQFDRTAPKALVAFSRDYRCRRCGHCFPAATAIWASLLFLIGGLPLTLAGLFSTVAGANDRNPVAQLLGMGMLFMGSTAAWHGGKTLLRSKITFEIED
jgi:hypothetical protein